MTGEPFWPALTPLLVPTTEMIVQLSMAPAQVFALGFGDGFIYAGISANADTPRSVVAPWSPVLGRWYHIAFTHDHLTHAESLYVDGRLVGAGPSATDLTTGKVGTLTPAFAQLTGSGNATAFLGDMDEVALWPSVRSAAEVNADMHACSPPALSSMIAYWSFDEGSGSVAHDGSPNHQDGALRLPYTPNGQYATSTWIVSSVPF